MRLGAQDVQVTAKARSRQFLHGEGRQRQPFMMHERFRHRYEVDPSVHRAARRPRAWSSAGVTPMHPIMQMLELPQVADTGPDGDRPAISHPYFVGRAVPPGADEPPAGTRSPLFMGLIAAAIRHRYPEAPTEEISSRWLPRPAATV
jgi:CTP synthase